MVPYFLVHKARECGYEPKLILAGRAVNDGMAKHVAEVTLKALDDAGKPSKDSRVLILGLTYKENVPDSRESQVRGIIEGLRSSGVEVLAHDPLLRGFAREFRVVEVADLREASRLDAVIACVNHDQFKKIRLAELKTRMNRDPVLVDIRQAFDRAEAESLGFYYWTL